MARTLQQFALVALAAIVIASELAETSRVCCLVDEDDVCCEGGATELPQLVGPDCCDDEGSGGGAATPHDAGTFAKLTADHAASTAPVVVIASAPRATRLEGSLAPRGVRRVLAPPVRIERIFATSRFLI